MNLNTTITPKSDQLNADDLISGPRTIKITSVDAGSADQPVSIHYEGDKGRPFKPSKSMRRVLVCIWGSDSDAYIGRRLTIYRDAAVKWAGEPVGGIRISHASDLSEPVSIALTETRGKRKPFKVEPLAPEQFAAPLENLPDTWANWSNEERGANRASLGLPALQAWWKTLSAAEKAPLKSILDSEWKSIAEQQSKKVAP